MTAFATSTCRLARAAGHLASVAAVAACLAPLPAGAASSGPSIRTSPGTALNAGTCRPKWPYIVLTCVA